MFGALTFLPLFLQIVKGVSPTVSGVRLFPLMGGLLVASIGSGQLVSRWGRYKVFPVVGTALMTVGLFLMSQIGVSTGAVEMSAYMFVFGLGLGLVMQVLVRRGAERRPLRGPRHRHLGSDFFRMIGGSFGTAVFGAVFANLRSAPTSPSAAPRHPAAGVNIKGSVDNPGDTPPAPGSDPGRGGRWDSPHHPRRLLADRAVRLRRVRLVVVAARAPPAPHRPHPRPHRVSPKRRAHLARRAGAGSHPRGGEGEPGRPLPHPGRARASTSPRARRGFCYRLSDWPQDTLEAIADRLGVSPQILEPAVDVLLKKGLVAESTGADGNRGLRLTAAGQVAVGKLLDARAEPGSPSCSKDGSHSPTPRSWP